MQLSKTAKSNWHKSHRAERLKKIYNMILHKIDYFLQFFTFYLRDIFCLHKRLAWILNP